MDLDLQIRRVITGHDPDGKAIIVEDEVLVGRQRETDKAGGDPRITGIELWGTATSPVDNSAATLDAQRDGWQGHTQEAWGQRSKFRIGKFPPGHIAPMHRTESIDYAILMEGECDLLLDGGEARRLNAGDVVIQRGTMHSWVGRGDKPSVWFFILLDAEPVEAGGDMLKQTFHEAPNPDDFVLR